MRKDNDVLCPCGSGTELAECCGPYLRGTRKPETAEQLMRSRYSAYVLQEVDYLMKTHDPETIDAIDPERAKAWSQDAKWLGLEVVSSEGGGKADEEGVVEFVARYELPEGQVSHHERSKFRRVGGGWVYSEGEMVKPKPVVRDGKKVGRNEPCPCGSGKKYKKCCGALG